MSAFDAVRHISALEAAERAGVPIKERGGRAWACCPFHEERTPSLRLYEEAERGWYCFGCHLGGDAVKLVELLYNLSPGDAARRLAEDFGIQVDEHPSEPRRPTAGDVRRGLILWRGQSLGRLRAAREAADAVVKGKAAALGGDSWDDAEFREMLTARAWADIEISALECASIDDLAAISAEGEPA
jgi:DNA primase